MERFDVVEVQRLNVVGPDGKLRFALANEEHPPPPILKGEEFGERQGSHGPMLIFYNELGDECGGLSLHAQERDGKTDARSMLLFDQFRGNEVLGLFFDHSGEKQSYGLVGHEPHKLPIPEFMAREKALSQIDDEDERAKAKEELYEGMQQPDRFFVGRRRDGAAVVSLSDANGTPRLRMVVEADGDPRIEFLNEEGEVTYRLPPSKEPMEQLS